MDESTKLEGSALKRAVNDVLLANETVREADLREFFASRADGEDFEMVLGGRLRTGAYQSRYGKISVTSGYVNPEGDGITGKEFATFMEGRETSGGSLPESMDKALQHVAKVGAKARATENPAIIAACEQKMLAFFKDWKKIVANTSPEEKRGRPKTTKTE